METIFSPGGVPPGGNGGDEFDRTAGLRTTGGDEELLQELAALFLEQYPRIMAGLGAATTAGDATAIAYSAHELKGSVNHFGAKLVADLAADLELLGRRGELGPAPAKLQELRAALPPLIGQLEAYLKP